MENYLVENSEFIEFIQVGLTFFSKDFCKIFKTQLWSH